jgi:hypothetical protein
MLSGGIQLEAVATHEIGHALGLGHYDGAAAIMNTYASASVTNLMQSDIDGIQSLYGAPLPVAHAPEVTENLGGDGVSDIVFHDDAGDIAMFDMHANGSSTAISFGANASSWAIEDVAKFGDGSDGNFLWRDSGSGDVVAWSVTADNKSPGYTDLGIISNDWTIQSQTGRSDFNGDGTDDILWRNSKTGDVAVWDMAHGKATSVVDLGSGPSSDWKVATTGDFTGDGKDDILWRNSSTGQNFIWEDGGSGPTKDIGTLGSAWSVVSTGDFTNDGVDDILWFNNVTHQAVYWNMKAGGNHVGSVDLGITPDGFTFDNARDLTGDGTADFLVHNASTGVVGYWANDPGISHPFHMIDTVSTAWHIT